MLIDPATGLPDKRPRPPSQGERSIAECKRIDDLLAWFNAAPPERDDDPHRPLMRLSWAPTGIFADPIQPLWQKPGEHGLCELRSLMDRILGRLVWWETKRLPYREPPGDFDDETVQMAKRVSTLIEEKKWADVKTVLDTWNAAPAEQIMRHLRDRHLDPDAQQVADRITAMIRDKQWAELKQLLNLSAAK